MLLKSNVNLLWVKSLQHREEAEGGWYFCKAWTGKCILLHSDVVAGVAVTCVPVCVWWYMASHSIGPLVEPLTQWKWRIKRLKTHSDGKRLWETVNSVCGFFNAMLMHSGGMKRKFVCTGSKWNTLFGCNPNTNPSQTTITSSSQCCPLSTSSPLIRSELFFIVVIWQVSPFTVALTETARLVNDKLQPFDLFSNCTLFAAFPARLHQLEDALFINDELWRAEGVKKEAAVSKVVFLACWDIVKKIERRYQPKSESWSWYRWEGLRKSYFVC